MVPLRHRWLLDIVNLCSVTWNSLPLNSLLSSTVAKTPHSLTHHMKHQQLRLFSRENTRSNFSVRCCFCVVCCLPDNYYSAPSLHQLRYDMNVGALAWAHDNNSRNRVIFSPSLLTDLSPELALFSMMAKTGAAVPLPSCHFSTKVNFVNSRRNCFFTLFWVRCENN